MMGYDGGWGGTGVVGMLVVLAFWVAVIALAIWAVRAFAPRRDRGPTAREILDRRYAAGEIDREAYEQARRTLEGPTPATR